MIALPGRSADDDVVEISEAQKAFILKQSADGMPVEDLCRKAWISPATYFNWKNNHDRLLRNEMHQIGHDNLDFR